VQDAPLIARVVAEDDHHAFATLVRRHQGSVRAFLLRLCCGDRALADDLAQEAFLHAYRRIQSYRSEGGFASWLLAIAYRIFLSEKRKRRWSAEDLRDDLEVAQPAPQASGAAADDVARAMRHLHEGERACLSLCYQWGMTHEEAADVLELPVGTVKTHIARGKEKLRARLSAYRPEQKVQG
jgi:RNA polymerase sigma-70 factor (ECF subfamily)